MCLIYIMSFNCYNKPVDGDIIISILFIRKMRDGETKYFAPLPLSTSGWEQGYELRQSDARCRTLTPLQDLMG